MAHYNSFVRIPLLVLRNSIAPLPRIGMLETDALNLRVWPNDVDFNLHLNNARYLSVMDYGRVRLLAGTGLLTPSLKARWAPVVGAVWMTYRRSLELWAGINLRRGWCAGMSAGFTWNRHLPAQKDLRLWAGSKARWWARRGSFHRKRSLTWPNREL